MKTFLNLITKYAILLTISWVFIQTWPLFIKPILFDILYDKNETIDTIWWLIPSIFSYLIQIIIAIMLWIDMKNHQINYKILPFIGLFYPVLGISGFLILLIFDNYKEVIE